MTRGSARFGNEGRRQGARPYIRAPATGPCPCRRPSVGNRRLYTLAAPAADPFVGPRVYPRPTPARPPPESGRQIYMYLAQDVQKMFKNISFYSVSWPSADMTCASQGAGGVGYACRADSLNRHFVGVGHISCLTYPQHRPKIANISQTYAQHSLQDGST